MNTNNDKLRSALDLVMSNLQSEIDATRARITSLVNSVKSDARDLVARHEREGADTVETSFLTMHVRDLTDARATLRQLREYLRELKNTIEYADK